MPGTMPAVDKDSSQEILLTRSGSTDKIADQDGVHRVSRVTGQFSTPPEIARVMAAWVEPPSDSSEIRILDPGSGDGVLSATLVRSLISVRQGLHVRVDAYEIDERLAGATTEALSILAGTARTAGSSLEFRVHASDFLADWGRDGQSFDGSAARFDVVIQNPPYSKIRRGAPQPIGAGNLVYGRPNVYALFLAKTARQLKTGGQMVAIAPRSWLSGAYFKRMRMDFFRRMALDRIHTFATRGEAFRKDSVLQETIIFHAKRVHTLPRSHVELSTSKDLADMGRPTRFSLPWTFLCPRGAENPIRLPESIFQIAALRELDSYSDRLQTLGLRVSTGPVVGFRSRRDLVEDPSKTSGHVPLIWIEDVGRGRLLWRDGSDRRHPAYLARRATTEKLVFPGEDMILVRRFSAKEDRFRVIACHLQARGLGPSVAVENKVNVIRGFHGRGGSRAAEAVCWYLNSEIVNQYVRAVSGTTQVNAYELNSLPFPPMETLVGRHNLEMQDDLRLEAT
jgi:adenine-specific DNA-methyltransferase